MGYGIEIEIGRCQIGWDRAESGRIGGGQFNWRMGIMCVGGEGAE